MILKRYYDQLKHEPCLVCGRYGVDIAHLRPTSMKVRDWSVRSHKDWRAFVAIPLCRKHHETIHVLGEDWLEDNLPGGKAFAYAWALTKLGKFIYDGGCNGED